MTMENPVIDGFNQASMMDRWCTPSVLPVVSDTLRRVDTEMSISIGSFGSHLNSSGILGDVATRAADYRHAGRALISANGSTGSNFVVMAFCAATRPGRPVLIPRNAHHSIHNAATAFGVRTIYLDQGWIGQFDAHRQPTINSVKKALLAYPDAAAVLITSPSYEGLIADISSISEIVHSTSDALVWVDQAWGSHLGWSGVTPSSAIDLGADIVVESTHKTGGAIQQSGLLLWNDDQVNSKGIVQAYRQLSTTSPQFGIFASIDLALESLARDPSPVEFAVETANDLRVSLAEVVGASNILNAAHPGYLDPLKVVVRVAGEDRSGADVAEQLAACGIYVEKYSPSAIALIPTFQLARSAPARLVDALASILGDSPVSQAASDPSPWHNLPNAPEVHSATDMMVNVTLNASIGCIAAEQVECYPPGIPILERGFRVTQAALDHLQRTRDNGGCIIADDPSLSTIRVFAGA